MSDNQPEKKPTNDVEYKGGWTQPASTGGWQAPEASQQTETGWKKIRAMPENLDTTPTEEGAWHLPKPEDTPFTPEDEITLTPATAQSPALRPEDMAFVTEPTAASSEETLPAETTQDEALSEDLETYSGLGELIASLSAVTDGQTQTSEAADDVEQDTVDALEAALESLDFSAERDALTQAIATDDDATELHPPDQLRQAVAENDAEASERATESDPAEIARQRVAELQQGLQDSTVEPTQATTESDAAEIARQRVAELGGQQPEPTQEPPQEDELTRRFRETEQQVRILRQQYHEGKLTRDQLQEELRKYMVLDDSDIWWMMGVESDTWYQHDKASGNWIMATPPVDLSAAKDSPATVTSEFTPADVIKGQLPYLPDDGLPAVTGHTGDTEYSTSATEPYTVDPDMPLPKSGTPIFDPDHTVPGRAAIQQDDIRFSDATTVNRATSFDAGATVPAQPAYQPAAYTADEPPVYDDFAGGTDIYQQAVERQRQSTLRRILLAASLLIGGVFILGALLIGYILMSYNSIANQYSTEIAELINYEPTFQTVSVRDADGNLLTELNSQDGGRRVSVSLSEISPELIFAIVGDEDPRYYENPGFNTLALGAAFIQNLTGGQVDNASSTITQQVANMVVVNQGGTPAQQRLHEIVIAAEIARNYDKNFILELYMNEVFFGNQSYGVEAASEFYFNKSASEVSLAEGSLLASLVRTPAITPVSQEVRDQSFDNMDSVLRRLAEVGCLNFQHTSRHSQYVQGQPFCISRNSLLNTNGEFTAQTNLQRAIIRAAEYKPVQLDNTYPHFVQYVNDLLAMEYGDEMFRRGFTVHTTLVPRISNVAQNALRQQLNNPNVALGLQTGAVLVVDPTNGNIMAMIGSPDFSNADIDGQVNNTLTWQQPGAAIAPIVYTAAFEGAGDRNGNGVLDANEYLTPATVLWDVPSQFQNPAFSPQTSNRGLVSARTALANNLNVPTVKAYNFIGSERFIDTAQRMGLNFVDGTQFGLPTGDGQTDIRLIDLVQAYSVLANTGHRVPLRAITRITDAEGNDVPLRGQLAQPEQQSVIPPQVSFLIQNILADNSARADTFGSNSPLFLSDFSDAIAAKAATSAEGRDAWTIGFSRNTVVGIWLGRPNNAPTQAQAINTAAPIFNTVMRAALEGRQRPGGFGAPGNTVPAGSVVTETICNYTGARPDDRCTERRNELFAADRHPPGAENGAVVNVAIDTWTGLRANQICPDNIVTGTFVNLFPSDPWAIQWLASAQGQQTTLRMGLPYPPQSPPTEECTVNNVLPTGRIVSPAEGQAVSENVQITGAVSAPNFDRYQIELAPANTGDFTIIAGPFQNQQPTLGALLAEWDSRTVNNGQYVLRLSMFATAAGGGGYINRDVNIIVQNILPTPTPMPTATPMLSSPTTLPFPTSVFPTQDAGSFSAESFGNPTATATITIGG